MAKRSSVTISLLQIAQCARANCREEGGSGARQRKEVKRGSGVGRKSREKRKREREEGWVREESEGKKSTGK